MAESVHALPSERVLDRYETDHDGLSGAEATERRETAGENEIARSGGRSPVSILLTQFDSVLIWVLLVAAALSFWAGHAVDTVLIVVIVLANGLFGFLQDYRAERSLESLRELAAPTATVRRDDEAQTIAATELVPGDIVLLESGDVVPADGRLLEETDLEVDEAALTGESAPVSKVTAPLAADQPLAERQNMVYKGTNVTRGRAVAVVTETGMETEVGGIAAQLAASEEMATPLQADLDRLGRALGAGVLVAAALVVTLLLVQGRPTVEAGLTAISLAVAAVPEGLPAAVTLTLALGVRRMSEENALVRRLPAIEALGSVDVICTDKTGTLTKAQMTVSRLWLNDTVVEMENGEPQDREQLLLRIGTLCNDATLDSGSPTEQALLDAADGRGLDTDSIRADQPRTDEVPFSSERKWMGTRHDETGYVKGAPEVVVEMCDRVLTEEGSVELTDQRRRRITTVVEEFGDDALRVLAFAYREDIETTEDLRDGLVFVGLAGLIDPPREEIAGAIAATQRAGIDVKMVTGDNVRTGRAIAESVGFGTAVLEGREIEAMDDETLRDRVESVDVFARTSPEHKVRILRALQDRGHQVAMTGDGVNDAPALKNADVGVAMGVRGTDVAREASDIVLLDDNYATIERAVERGRAIFDNIWKFVGYLLSANVAEVAIVFIASLYGYLVLPAVQLLWINLLTDGLPALALGADPRSGDVMDRPPRDPDERIVSRQMLGLIGGTGAVTTAVMLALMFGTLDDGTLTAYTITMVFTGFVALEFEKLYVIRWLRRTPTRSNRWLAVAVGISIALQLAVLYTPLNQYFGTVALGLADWAIIAGVLLVCLPAYLGVAFVLRRYGPA